MRSFAFRRRGSGADVLREARTGHDEVFNEAGSRHRVQKEKGRSQIFVQAYIQIFDRRGAAGGDRKSQEES